MAFAISALAFLAAAAGAATISSYRDSHSIALKPPQGRVINGYTVARGEAPFIVSIKNGTHYCGGSIIDPHWVLTAAHCLTGRGVEVVAGLHERHNETHAQVRNVTSRSFFPHPEFLLRRLRRDIGLIYVEEAFVLNAGGAAPVASISLPTGRHEEMKRARLYGWGLSAACVQPDALQASDLDIISSQECSEAMPVGVPLHPENICTFTPGVVNGPCDTDSGSPLVVRHPTEGSEVVGIVSWAPLPCTTRDLPSVFTSVRAFQSWINNTITSAVIKKAI